MMCPSESAVKTAVLSSDFRILHCLLRKRINPDHHQGGLRVETDVSHKLRDVQGERFLDVSTFQPARLWSVLCPDLCCSVFGDAMWFVCLLVRLFVFLSNLKKKAEENDSWTCPGAIRFDHASITSPRAVNDLSKGLKDVHMQLTYRSSKILEGLPCSHDEELPANYVRPT